MGSLNFTRCQRVCRIKTLRSSSPEQICQGSMPNFSSSGILGPLLGCLGTASGWPGRVKLSQGPEEADRLCLASTPHPNTDNTCHFEDEKICGYTQDLTDNFDWTRQNALTQNPKRSPNTGPPTDISGTPEGKDMACC